MSVYVQTIYSGLKNRKLNRKILAKCGNLYEHYQGSAAEMRLYNTPKPLYNTVLDITHLFNLHGFYFGPQQQCYREVVV